MEGETSLTKDADDVWLDMASATAPGTGPVSDVGMVLVRPDGYIAWAGPADDTEVAIPPFGSSSACRKSRP